MDTSVLKSRKPTPSLKVVALAGGVGGAKLAQGLALSLSPAQLCVIVNSGDDFEYLGLTICPDLDTVTYTLANLANPETGWGIASDTFHCLANLEKLGEETWFRLGDRDLATHIYRTTRLRAGERLTVITQKISHNLGIEHTILPMCDTSCRTMVMTPQGEMDFQTYFVRYGWQPVIQGFRWEGIESACPSGEVLAALQAADLVVICPSNPFVSIDPILNLPGIKQIIHTKTTLAVSPIIGGEVVKGPAAKMFRELGIQPSALSVAEHYQGLLTGFILDSVDASLIEAVNALGMTACAMPTLMSGTAERVTVAQGVPQFGVQLLRA